MPRPPSPEKAYQRINVRVPRGINERLDMWAARLGLTKSQLAAICIQAGLGAVLRAVSPEDAVSPETMAKLVAMFDQIKEEDLEGLKK